MKTNLTVCVAIPTYNREQVLLDTINYVLRQRQRPDEILVIDQTPHHEPETAAFLQTAHNEQTIRWIKQSPPNLNRARNRALWETRCDIIIYIDDDIEPVDGFIAHHLSNYRDPDVVAVAGRTIQARGNTSNENMCPWLRPLKAHHFVLDGQERVEGVAAFIGANHSVRTETLRQIGGYDENYVGPLFDESDVALTLWKHGRKIVFDPRAEVFHLQSPSGGTRLRKKRRQSLPEYQMSFTRIYFHWKHFFPTTYFWKQILFVQFRRSVLRRDNILHPWRLPWALLSYGYSLVRACSLLINKDTDPHNRLLT